MKLRSRDFGDRIVSCVASPMATLNEAPKPRLRRSDSILSFLSNGEYPSMKLRSRDFGDFGACSSAVAVVVGPSMKLRSRDFGDEVMVKSRSVPVFPQ